MLFIFVYKLFFLLTAVNYHLTAILNSKLSWVMDHGSWIHFGRPNSKIQQFHVSDAFFRNAMMSMLGWVRLVILERCLMKFSIMRGRWQTRMLWKWESEDRMQWLFDVIPERNVITWIAMFPGYATMKDLVAAKRYFDRMLERSVV